MCAWSGREFGKLVALVSCPFLVSCSRAAPVSLGSPLTQPPTPTPTSTANGQKISGLVSLKICLEAGLRATCYEKSAKYGGLWNYRPDECEPGAPFEPSVMRTTVLNTSKELSAFSDFPPAATLANFMRHNHYMDYIRSYVDHFKLGPHLKLEHEILHCQPERAGCGLDGAQTRWSVQVRSVRSGELSRQTFDRLMVAVGHHNVPFEPAYAGQDRFKGEVLHSARLKSILTNEKFADKRVLVVGLGNSACDAANDIATISSKCYVSCHRGQWFTGRFLAEGPYDFRTKSRLYYYATKLLPARLIDRLLIGRLERQVNHQMLGLKPKHRPSEQVPAINDLFPYRIYTGGIVLKGPIRSFTEGGVIFEGEEGCEYPIDLVVLATGYEARVPFLDELQLGLRRTAEQGAEYDLFLNIFAPNLRLPAAGAGPATPTPTPTPAAPWDAIKSLAFIGLVQPSGSITVISELQARYAALVFTGQRDLPGLKEMLAHMERTRRMRSKSIRSHSRDQLVGSYVGYMETLSRLIGARPNLAKMFFSDHKLWRQLMFGPCVPYQYRLSGPGCWPEARAVTLATKERVNCGINEGMNHILFKSRRKRLIETKPAAKSAQETPAK